MYLSKSKYIKGLQCPKMLWMDKYMPEKAPENPNLEAIFATGNMVGDLAMQYFGDFVEVTELKEDGKLDLGKMIERTK